LNRIIIHNYARVHAGVLKPAYGPHTKICMLTTIYRHQFTWLNHKPYFIS